MVKLMVDLCAGLGGASASFKEAGWDVIRVDIEERFQPEIVADVMELKGSDITYLEPTLVWASPPCTEFARESMPWCRTGKEPSLDLVHACIRIIRELEPRYWVLENVRGAQKWLKNSLGGRVKKVGPFYLWGNFPPFDPIVDVHKEKYWSDKADLRALIPRSLSYALLKAIEADMGE